MVAMKRDEIINNPEPEIVRGFKIPLGKILFSLSASFLKKNNNSTTPDTNRILEIPVVFTTPA